VIAQRRGDQSIRFIAHRDSFSAVRKRAFARDSRDFTVPGAHFKISAHSGSLKPSRSSSTTNRNSIGSVAIARALHRR